MGGIDRVSPHEVQDTSSERLTISCSHHWATHAGLTGSLSISILRISISCPAMGVFVLPLFICMWSIHHWCRENRQDVARVKYSFVQNLWEVWCKESWQRHEKLCTAFEILLMSYLVIAPFLVRMLRPVLDLFRWGWVCLPIFVTTVIYIWHSLFHKFLKMPNSIFKSLWKWDSKPWIVPTYEITLSTEAMLIYSYSFIDHSSCQQD